MTKSQDTIKKAIAHGNYIRGSASKVRRTYRGHIRDKKGAR